jgi:AraC family transcriptional regulator of adaptative response / DNA-3-methyladenine glycosylase II
MGVSPKAYLDTRRLLLAKQLLTDSDLPVTEVAQAAGFASLRRFHAASLQQYRLNPGMLRSARGAGAKRPAQRSADTLSCRLGYRPPYDIEGVLRFLRDRAVTGLETVEGLQWRRTLAWPVADGQPPSTGWIAARFDSARHEVEVTISASLHRATGALLPLVRQALDLDADPSRIDPVLADLPVPARPGIRVPGGMEGFETAARVILGQQVTVAAARTLTGRLVQALGSCVDTPHAGLTRLFPSAQQVASASAETLGRLGIVRQRVRALQAVAQAVASGRLALNRSAPLEPTLNALRDLPGIGEWTVQLIAMRALAWPDAFPVTDIAVLNALGTRDTRAVAQQAQAWRPWRAYAVMRLWQSLLKPQAEPPASHTAPDRA